MKKVIQLLAMAVLLLSCAQSEKNMETPIVHIDVNAAEGLIDASWLLDTTECAIIPLQNSTEPIGTIAKIQAVDSFLYVLDSNMHCLHVFTDNGTYLRTIKRLGKSSEEYLEISDFYVENGRIYILDQNSMKVLVLNNDGSFNTNIKINDYWANNLFAIDGKIFLMNNNSEAKAGKYRLFKIDSAGKCLDKYIPFNEKFGVSSMGNNYSTLGNSAIFCQSPINVIYEVTEKDFKPYMQIDFGSQNLPKEYYEYDLIKILKEGLNKKYVLGIDGVEESSAYIFLRFRYSGQQYLAIVNKKTNEVERVCSGLAVDDMYSIGLADYHVCGDFIYDIYSAYDFITLYNEILKDKGKIAEKYKKQIADVIKNISKNSNPVIIKYKVKR